MTPKQRVVCRCGTAVLVYQPCYFVACPACDDKAAVFCLQVAVKLRGRNERDERLANFMVLMSGAGTEGTPVGSNSARTRARRAA